MRRSIIVLVLVAAVGLLLGTQPAGATLQEGFTIRPGPPVEKSYPRIESSYPFNDARNTTTCQTVTHCDVMVVKIERPQLGPDEDFIISIYLSWDYQKVNGTTTNDLDLAVHLPQHRLPPTARPYDGTGVVGRSQCCEPEKVTLFNPPESSYYVMVMNASGVNNGYTLKGEITTTTAVLPDEFLGLDEGGGDALVEDRSADEFSDSFFVEPTGESGAAFISGGALAPIEPDDELASISSGSGFDDLLRGPAQLIGRPPVDDRPPKPVSGPVVALWGGVFPLTVVAGGWLALKSRNPAGLEAV